MRGGSKKLRREWQEILYFFEILFEIWRGKCVFVKRERGGRKKKVSVPYSSSSPRYAPPHLQLPDSTECFDAICAPETLSGDDVYSCDTCACRRGPKQLRGLSLSLSLSLSLGRVWAWWAGSGCGVIGAR